MHPLRLLLAVPACVLAGLCLAAEPKKKPPPRGKEEALKLFVEEFVRITPGKGKHPASFVMGSPGDAPAAEKPPTRVTLAPFAIARYEVTQELYLAVTGKDPSKWKGPRNSVEMVSWADAVNFCKKVTADLRERKLIAANEVIRLPSEAEWEYACRAGTTTPYSFGGLDKIGEHAWYKDNSKGYDPPVGAKKPNPWGLYDMHGYIWEWCADSWHPGHKGASATGKPRVKKGEKGRVLRGGSWADPANACRSAYRRRASVDFRSDKVGFRCVLAREK
jgi:formylglycine-generating enzyme required for sulfatase activity